MQPVRANLNAKFKVAAALCKELQAVFPHTYITGGAVRSALLGLPVADVDIATEATPMQIKKFLTERGKHFYDVGEKFGTVGVVPGSIEITTMRAEGEYVDRRHPSTVEFVKSVRLDAGRRDFTVNAIYYDPTHGQLLDFYGGLVDLQKKVLRFIGKPASRIGEDPLRMLRLVRFAATLGFTVGRADAAAVKANAKLVLKVAAPRVFDELNKIMASSGYLEGLKLIDELGLVEQILPEVSRLKKVRQSANYHAEGNVFVHTFAVLSHLNDASPEMRWTGLLHDVGKFGTAKKSVRDGRVHISFHGHAQAGAEVVRAIAQRLAFPASLRGTIMHLTSHHMDFTITPSPQNTAARLKWASDPRAESVIRLRIADSMGAIMTDAQGNVIEKDTAPLRAAIRQIKRDRKIISADFVTGEDVKELLNVPQGERVGKILRSVKLAQLEKKVTDRRSAILFLKKLDIHRV